MAIRRTEAEADEIMKYFDLEHGYRKIELPRSWIVAAPSTDYESVCCSAAIYAHTHGEDVCVVAVDGGYIQMSAGDCWLFYGKLASEVAECSVSQDGTLTKIKYQGGRERGSDETLLQR